MEAILKSPGAYRINQENFGIICVDFYGGLDKNISLNLGVPTGVFEIYKLEMLQPDCETQRLIARQVGDQKEDIYAFYRYTRCLRPAFIF